MGLEIKVIESTPRLLQRFMVAILPELNDFFRVKQGAIQDGVKKILEEAIKESFEYNDLLDGLRRAEFGLDNPQSRLDAVIQVWLDSVKTTIIPIIISGKNFKGGMEITAIQSSYLDVLALRESIVFSKGGQVPWLEWMLVGLSSPSTFIKNYTIIFKPTIRGSRSGHAIMAKSDNYDYRVPNELLGSQKDNWITRLISKMEPQLIAELERILT